MWTATLNGLLLQPIEIQLRGQFDMAQASLNLSIISKRMMNQREAADYAGLAAKRFKQHCPVQPIEVAPRELRWDKIDLDQWLDGLKLGNESQSRAEVLSRL